MAHETYEVYIDLIPPSSNMNNGVGGRGHPKAVARTKKAWEEIFGGLLMGAGVPRGCSKITVKPRLQFRTKGRRDADNFYFAISKPLGDTLTGGGWLEDDDYSRYEFERPQVELGVELPDRVKGRTLLTLVCER